MKDVLTQIIADKRVEVARQMAEVPIESYQKVAALMPPTRSMSRALATSQSGIIAEFKRRSPSKGWICESADAAVIPQSYAEAGASALSILTDESYFGGTLNDLEVARALVDKPIIRKEFIVSEYQIYQSRAYGADAILLIASALSKEECSAFVECAHSIGLEVLLEIHSEEELGYIAEQIDMVGVNNRNLGSFVTDVANSFRLAGQLPESVVKVSESGISDPDTVSELRAAGYRGFLIGENFMRTEEPGQALLEFIAKVE